MINLTTRRALQSGVKRVARDFDRLVPPSCGVSVLEYHRVGSDTTAELNVDSDVFSSQMAHLAEHCHTTTLSEAVVDLRTVPPLDRNQVAVTFDDGTIDLYDHAMPILLEHAIPSLIYVATDFIDRQRPFPLNGVPLTWDALREMTATGLVEVGSHTHTHAVVDKLDSSELRSELQRSKDRIEDELQRPVQHFAYPKGVRARGDLAEVVAEAFETAAIAGASINRFMKTDLQCLDRVPIQRSDDWESFVSKVWGGMRLEGHMRNTLNRVRYAQRTN